MQVEGKRLQLEIGDSIVLTTEEEFRLKGNQLAHDFGHPISSSHFSCKVGCAPPDPAFVEIKAQFLQNAPRGEEHAGFSFSGVCPYKPIPVS